MIKHKQFDIIVTLPEQPSRESLLAFQNEGATYFRINGSFLGAEGIADLVSQIKSTCGTKVKTLLDLPGYKPRFTGLPRQIEYVTDEPIHIAKEHVNYPEIFDHADVGGHIRINDGMVRLTIRELDDSSVTLVPDNSGILRRGKGFYMENKGYRPCSSCLSDADKTLLRAAVEHGIDSVGVSFVHNENDLREVRTILDGSGVKFIPKLESRQSFDLENLLPLLRNCDMVIMDRGDTAGEIGLKNVWAEQRKVLRLAKLFHCKVIMATQFFITMVKNNLPSIAEIDSYYDLLNLGISGVQMSEETCIGDHALEVVRLARRGCNDITSPKTSNGQGKVIWIMGPTSSGKTTIAQNMLLKMRQAGINAVHFDGDEVRDMFGDSLGFRPEDRMRVVSALTHYASKAAKAGQVVLVSALTAHEDARNHIKEHTDQLVTVYLECPIETCAERDSKGLYKQAKEGKISTLIGYNTPYIPPTNPDLVLPTNECDAEESADNILQWLATSNAFALAP